jgi:CheY-like chemotaxis protein
MFGNARNGLPALYITSRVTLRHASSLAAAAPVRVLVVDDNSEIRMALCRWLSTFPGVGWIADAASAFEALSGLKDTRPHLVVTDVDMPEMSGFELARRLATMPDAPRVVVMSLSNSRDYQTLTRWAGADAFIDKLDLYEALSHYLSAALSPTAE